MEKARGDIVAGDIDGEGVVVEKEGWRSGPRG